MDRSNSEIYTLIVSGIAVLSTMVLFILYFVIRYQQKQRQNAIDKKNAKLEFERLLMRTQLEIQEETMNMISQEIHDNIGQMLSLAKLNLALAKAEIPDHQRITDSHNLVSNSIYELRHLAHSLDKEFLAHQELYKSLQFELEMINRTGLINTQLIIEGTVTQIEKQKELILFRITQETLNNIIKHAKADSIKVLLNYSPEGIKLEVIDNGVGFRTQQARTGEAQGSGIGNMYNRAAVIGANLTIDSIPGEGTRVSIYLPSQKSNNET